MSDDGGLVRDGFHAARWLEPLIMGSGTPGERGVIPPAVEPSIRDEVGDVLASIPPDLRRARPPALPELSQPQVLRHYLRLSQETLGAAVNIDVGLGTCTMKYNPVINDVVGNHPNVSQVHPGQPPETIQGLLGILHRLERQLCEISGMDAFSLQPGGGAAAIFTNASIMRAHHDRNGEGDRRDEIITTVFSHPADAAASAAAGYKIITLYPDDRGYPDFEALEAALSERTAGLMVTNPEDTGIFNPRIRDYTEAVHAVGGVCAIDQANANGILGITRARELGFDLSHFNLHKTFSTPHNSEGPGLGAVGVREDFARYLPVPIVSRTGKGGYRLDYDRPDSIGKVKGFLGNVGIAVRAYAWIMAHGAEGLRTVAETSVLNNNYLARKLDEIPGITVPYRDTAAYRLQEVRYSWERLHEETGVSTNDIKNRMIDYGVNSYFTSHEPWLIAEPFTAEPAESYSKQDLDEYAAIVAKVAEEAYTDPERVRSGPHRSSISGMDEAPLIDPDRVVTTWRAWKKRYGS